MAAAVVRPVWRRNGVPVAGQDEDAFTLAVDALDRLLEPAEHSRRVDELHLAGDPSPADGDAYRRALGLDGTELTVHRPGADGLVAALEAAQSSASRGRSTALASVELGGLDGASDQSSPRAIALRWGTAGGIDVGSTGSTDSAAAGENPNTGLFDLLEQFRSGSPSASKSAESATLDLVGKTSRVSLHRPANIQWLGPWGSMPTGLEIVRAGTAMTEPPLDVVSEGAYVPWPRYLENLPSRWRLAADACGHCSQVTFPQRGRCRHCGLSDRLQTVELPRVGTVEATTTVGVGAQPTEFDHQVAAAGPYEVVIVGLAQGARATFQITDALAGSVRIGGQVHLKLRRLYPMEGQWRYGLKAVPA